MSTVENAKPIIKKWASAVARYNKNTLLSKFDIVYKKTEDILNMGKHMNMKTLLAGALYFAVAFSSLYFLNPGVNIYAILLASSIATAITLLLFWGATIYAKKKEQTER